MIQISEEKNEFLRSDEFGEWPPQIRFMYDTAKIIERNYKAKNFLYDSFVKNAEEEGNKYYIDRLNDPKQKEYIKRLNELIAPNNPEAYYLEDCEEIELRLSRCIEILDSLIKNNSSFNEDHTSLNAARICMSGFKFFIERLDPIKKKLDIDEMSGFITNIRNLKLYVPALSYFYSDKSHQKKSGLEIVQEEMVRLPKDQRIHFCLEFLTPELVSSFSPDAFKKELLERLATVPDVVKTLSAETVIGIFKGLLQEQRNFFVQRIVSVLTTQEQTILKGLLGK